MNLLEKFKPAVRKRTLLFVAGFVWSIAGCILIGKALVPLFNIHHHLLLEITLGIVCGIGFYFVLFAMISKKHITRISLLKVDNPCFFSFFNFRSYLLMLIMITVGITLRKLNIINKEYMFTFYLAMGIPLLMSAIRFFKAGIKNNISA